MERLSISAEPSDCLSSFVKVLLSRAELICRSRVGLGWLQCCAVTTDWLADWRYHGQGQGSQ